MPSNEELHDELQALRDELRQLRSQLAVPVAAGEATPRLMSRRNLLRAAPVVAAGGAIAAMSASPAAASVGQAVIQGQVNNAGTSTTTLTGGTPSAAGGVDTTKPSALRVNGGIKGDWLSLQGITVGSNQGAALIAEGSYLQGYAGKFVGAPAPTSHGESGNPAVLVTAIGPGAGVTVEVQDGFFDDPSTPQGGDVTYPSTGLAVSTHSGPALDATSDATVVALASQDSAATTDALTVAYAGKGRAVYAVSASTTNINGTVTGVNAGNGIGLWGEQRGTGSGFGVVGVGGKAGRGARLSGGAAALQLLPASASTHPTTGKAGDLFVDSAARLWYCQKASSGATAAVWKQLA